MKSSMRGFSRAIGHVAVGWLSLIILAAPAVAQAPVVALPTGAWTKFIDPYEGAFSLDVPAGWRVSGGLARRGALQVWQWITATSPDGSTMLLFGDPNLQIYTLPNQVLEMAGLGEGSAYDGGGGPSVIRRYWPGEEFAADYGRGLLPRFCTDIQMTAVSDRSDVSARFNLLGSQTTVGDARFTCQENGAPMEGYFFCATSLFALPAPVQGAGLWSPSVLYGFLAPRPLAGIAAGLAAHMLETIAVNPQWAAGQAQTNMAVSRIATETGHAMSSTITQTWEQRGAILNRVMDEDSRVRLGIDIYANPSTGTHYTVENTHQYYWVNPQGAVVGTDTDTPPAGFERLQRVPPGQ